MHSFMDRGCFALPASIPRCRCPSRTAPATRCFPCSRFRGVPAKSPSRFARLGAAGIIGRIQTPAIARTLLSSGLPAIAVDLTEKQLADGNPLSRISEICCRLAQRGPRRGGASPRTWIYVASVSADTKGESGRTGDWKVSASAFKRAGIPAAFTSRPNGIDALPWCREQPLVTAWLRSLAKPVGVMACNDIRGRQVIEACLQAGLRVPDDVAVVGVDEDRLLCELANPPMSSVVLNLERAGYQAAELLDGLMAGRVQEPQRISVEALWVIPRRSTDVVAIEDRHVAAAATIHSRPLPSGHHRGRRRSPIGISRGAAWKSVSSRSWGDRSASKSNKRGWPGARGCWWRRTSRPKRSPSFPVSAA